MVIKNRNIGSVVFRRTLCLGMMVVLLNFAAQAQARTIYIDPALSGNCLTTYDPAKRSCGSGTAAAYSTLSSGLVAGEPGDIILLRAGTYGRLAFPSSGSSGKPITVKAYPGENPTIANLSSSVAITIDNLAYITIDGLKINNVRGFGHVYDSEHIVIKNCTFDQSGAGTTGSMKLVRSTYCKVLSSCFSNAEDDMLILQDASNKNIIEGNRFDTAGHSLISIRCSEYNVIKNNTLKNPDQKAVEIYDCEGVSDAPFRLNSTKRNVFEGNSVIETKASSRDYRYNAMQHGAQFTIVRYNLFRNCKGGGINYQSYSDESLYVYGNRMYNNTFYDNRCYGIIGNSGSSSRYYDNRVTNNLLYKNSGCDGSGGQTRISDSSVVILYNNALATGDPQFTDEAANDFRLAVTSPHIDSGGFITATVAAGSGKSLAVADASYLYDGFGIAGETGDLIQMEGQTDRVRIITIDYEANVLTLDRPLTWTKGQGVHLSYAGNAPDMGAFEYGLESPELLSPSNLSILK